MCPFTLLRIDTFATFLFCKPVLQPLRTFSDKLILMNTHNHSSQFTVGSAMGTGKSRALTPGSSALRKHREHQTAAARRVVGQPRESCILAVVQQLKAAANYIPIRFHRQASPPTAIQISSCAFSALILFLFFLFSSSVEVLHYHVNT